MEAAERRPSHEGQERKRPAIGKVGRGLPSARCSEAPPAALLQGIEEFNQQRFFEQHETLEDAWIEESDPVRYLYQGILQIGVGFYHLGRGNYRGADRLIQRGVGYLRPFQPACMGVDVERLIVESEQAHRHLIELGPERLSAFDRSLLPCVYLVDEIAPGATFDV
jgi:predicted metal-dependent hydrolase